jgi:hypothetical protein
MFEIKGWTPKATICLVPVERKRYFTKAGFASAAFRNWRFRQSGLDADPAHGAFFAEKLTLATHRSQTLFAISTLNAIPLRTLNFTDREVRQHLDCKREQSLN